MFLSTTALMMPALLCLLTTIYQHTSTALLYPTISLSSDTTSTTRIYRVTKKAVSSLDARLDAVVQKVKNIHIFFRRHSELKLRSFQSTLGGLKLTEQCHNLSQSSTPPTATALALQPSVTHGTTTATSSTSSIKANPTLSIRSGCANSRRQIPSLVLPPVNELPGGGYQCAVM
jgi:hypothetical protein